MAGEEPKPVVLVVEDETVTRFAALEMLERAGFVVIEARDGVEALKALEATPAIQAVLTDIEMPACIDGIRLAAVVHRRWPRTGIVITSGKVRPRAGDVPAAARYFAKPYDEDAVTAALQDLVARS